MEKNIILLTAVLLALFLVGCSSTLATVEPIEKEYIEIVQKEKPVVETIKEDQLKLKIIVTSDIEGAIFSYDYTNNKETDFSQLSVASYVEQQRKEDQEVVLLDGGNVLQGNALLYYYNYVNQDKQHIVSQVMNAMQYDGASISKKDFELPPEVYLRVASQFDFPLTVANIFYKENNEAVTPPYVIVEKGPFKIGVIGLIATEKSNDLIDFADIAESAKSVMEELSFENLDLVVGLVDADNESLERLISETDHFFNLIFLTGENVDAPPFIEGVPILQASHSVATATATFSFDQKQLIDLKTENVLVKERATEKGYEAQIDQFKKWLNQQVGSISETISSRDAMFGDSKFVDLIHFIQLEIAKSDLSLASPLAFDTQIEEGNVYIRDIFALYPFEHKLVSLRLLGREIKNILELSYDMWFNQMKSLDDDLITFKDDNYPYETAKHFSNYISLAGVNYVVDITKGFGQRVTLKTLKKGGAFKMDEYYTVAINSEQMQNLGIEEQVVATSDKDLRYYIIEAFENSDAIIPTVDNNWLVIPNLWVQRGIKNSYPKLYPTL